MTHDDLLHTISSEYAHNKAIQALYEVVELHKPIKDEWFNVGEIICEECTREEYTKIYPCDTIQAIEKELG